MSPARWQTPKISALRKKRWRKGKSEKGKGKGKGKREREKGRKGSAERGTGEGSLLSYLRNIANNKLK
jgi:hypothetical protein